MNKSHIFKPEVLAPAGDAERAYFAAEAGADAVYFGLQNFSARQAATNIEPQVLATLVDDLHRQGVRCYVTLNTILYEDELVHAGSYLDLCVTAGVDAIITQDLYWLQLFSELCPPLELHASTQMNIHSDLDIAAAAKLGYNRVVLPRETSSAQLRLWTKQAQELGLSTEFFVHGAVCMAVSGRCQMSFAQGGRSANRGACAQACRLAYQLYSRSGKQENLLEQGALLSAKDQSLITQIPIFSELKVDSLKIEGRMKDAAYVRATTAAYRQAVDFWAEHQDPVQFAEFAGEQEQRLLQVFNRGGAFTKRSFCSGDARQHTTGDFVGSHGIALGQIVRTAPNQGSITVQKSAQFFHSLSPKDQIAVRLENKQIATAPVGVVEEKKNQWQIKGFHPQKIRLMRSGDEVFLLRNYELENQLADHSSYKLNLDYQITIFADYFIVKASTEIGRQDVSVARKYSLSDYDLLDQSLPQERWSKQLRKTGQTIFQVGQINYISRSDSSNNDLPALRVSSINQIRRETIELLQTEIARTLQNNQVKFKPDPELLRNIKKNTDSETKTESKTSIHAGPKTLLSIILPESLQRLEQLNLGSVDQVEISLLFLSNLSFGQKIIVQMQQQNPELEILIRLPEIMQAQQNELFRKLLLLFENQLNVGFSASGLSILKPELYELNNQTSKLLHVNEQANIINSKALQLIMRNNEAGISISPEWNDSGLNQVLTNLSDVECARIYIPYNYLIPEMFLNYCPVGKNIDNCKKCITDADAYLSRTYRLKTDQAPFTEHHLVTYPVSCISHIFTTSFDNQQWHDLSAFNKQRVSRRISDLNCNYT
ncbi:MAG: peptidase U32 family protein [Saccharofermentanales bacterium]|jgi:collagenase-like PrtC family protease